MNCIFIFNTHTPIHIVTGWRITRQEDFNKRTPEWGVLFKRGAGAKRGAPCCAANHSLCVLGAVDRCRALVLGQTGHTLLSGEGDRIVLITESSGDLPIMHATAAFKGSVWWASADASLPVTRVRRCSSFVPRVTLMSARDMRHTLPP